MSVLKQQRLIQVLSEHRDAIADIDRCPGYGSELFSTLTNIIAMERQNAARRIDIQKKVDDQLDALATVLLQSDWRTDRAK